MFGIRIKSSTSGLLMGLRKSVEQIESEDVYIQGTDLTSKQLSLVQLRQVTVADSGDISDPATDLGTPITMNDNWNIVVFPYHSIATGVCRITPILICGSDIGEAETKESSVGDTPLHDGTNYVSPRLSWDVTGADTVYLRVAHINIGGLNTLTLKGGAI